MSLLIKNGRITTAADAYEADILCEGHYGIFQPADRVERYIRSCLERQEP